VAKNLSACPRIIIFTIITIIIIIIIIAFFVVVVVVVVCRTISQDTDYTNTGHSGDRIPVADERYCNSPERPKEPPNLLFNGSQEFPAGKAAGVWS
jgi:flagellar basal body-associated protein FliL